MNEPRRIAVLTGSRSEYGLFYWTIRAIHEDPDLKLVLLVTGTHLSPEFGLTIQDIESDGFPIAARVEMLLSSDTGEGTATSIGVGTVRMAHVLASLKPDLLLVLGDRFEVLATVSAALPLLIPVAHIHGGESTEGVIDEGIRHAVSKMCHLHFAATEFYARRLVQMGEEEWRVKICGAPGLEYLYRTEIPSREELEQELGLNLSEPTLLVTYHPVTLSRASLESDMSEVLAALEESGLPVVITYPNADMGGRAIIQSLQDFQVRCPRVQVRVNLGFRQYQGMLRQCAAMVGNSSSGIIEAASFGLPVVNIGDRQKGRLRGLNVLDAPAKMEAILAHIKKAVSPEFRQVARQFPNPYDLGKSSEIIVRTLKEVTLDQRLIQKRIVDLPLTLAAKPAGARV